MPNEKLFYWDANVFLSYLNGNPDRVPVIEAILEKIGKSGGDKIVTSEMYAYDHRLHKYSEFIGIDIKDPVTQQPRLF